MKIKNIALVAIAACGLAVSSQAQRGLDIQVGARASASHAGGGTQQFGGRELRSRDGRRQAQRQRQGYGQGRSQGRRQSQGYRHATQPGRRHSYRQETRRYGLGRYGRRVVSEPCYRTERVWVPGYSERIYVPARYELRWDSCGRRRIRVCVQPAGYRIVEHPGHWERRRVLVHRHVERRRYIH